MRTTPVAATAALVAALALTACNGEGDDHPSQDSANKTATCEPDQFAIEFGPSNAAPVAGDTGNIPVTLTNRGSTCVLQGLPGTDVHSGGHSWVVRGVRSAKQPKLTLAQNAAATFTITYVRGVAGDPEKGVKPDRVKFTLPGDSSLQSYKWPDAEVAVKSEHELDITVSPFLPSGD